MKLKKGQQRSATITREHLADMHRQVKAICKKGNYGPGSEAYSLLCQLGASLGVWPRVKQDKAEQMTRRFKALQGNSRQSAGKATKMHPSARPPGWEPCPKCKVLIRSGARHECSIATPAQPPRHEPPPAPTWEACQTCHVMTQADSCHLCGNPVGDVAEVEQAWSEPRTVCGVSLNGYEVPLFDEAVRRGELVIGPEIPVQSPLVNAWQCWCEHEGKPCRMTEVTWKDLCHLYAD